MNITNALKPVQVTPYALLATVIKYPGFSRFWTDQVLSRMRKGGAEVGPISNVRTQVIGEEGGRPDLVAFDEDGSKHIVIEAKFWAGLTKNQPLTYFRHLPQKKPSVLLFIVPHDRRQSLWDELKQRIVKSEFDIPFKIEKNHEGLLSAHVGEVRWLILVSWKKLLDCMATTASADGDLQTEADIVQLRGLAVHADATAFMPLSSEDLGPDIPRRLIGLKNLVDRVTERLVESELASTEGLHASSNIKWYVRYMKFIGVSGKYPVAASLGIDHKKWATYRDTPLWLTFYEWKKGGNTKPIREIWKNLAPFRQYNPPEVLDIKGNPVMPIELPLGKEEGDVLDSIFERIEEIARQIRST
ncbi:MAG: PD-(D/E)XK nuclease family protein, partial [Bacteroidetes bacterium]|nr:PD-(D/E)XK nuclease family protein [Bacteroidota bacterium]